MKDYSIKKKHKEIKKDIPMIVLGVIAIILGVVFGLQKHKELALLKESPSLVLPYTDE